MSSELEQLRKILNDALDRITVVCERRKTTFPSLDSPADPSELLPSGIRNDPEILDAATVGVAAAAQLIATLQPPAVTLISSAFRVSLRLRLVLLELFANGIEVHLIRVCALGRSITYR